MRLRQVMMSLPSYSNIVRTIAAHTHYRDPAVCKSRAIPTYSNEVKHNSRRGYVSASLYGDRARSLPDVQCPLHLNPIVTTPLSLT